MLNIIRFLQKDESRLHQFLQKRSYQASSWCMLCMREASGKETSWSQILRSWKNLVASEIYARRLQCSRESSSEEMETTSNPLSADGTVTAICETSKTSCVTGKLLLNGVLENHSLGQFTLFGSIIEYHPICAKYQPTLHQSGKNVIPRIIPGDALCAGGICEVYLGRRHWGALKFRGFRNSCSKTHRKGGSDAEKRWHILILSQMEQSRFQEEIRCSKNSISIQNHCTGWAAQR